MADNDNDNENDVQNNTNSGSGLRKQLEAALEKNATFEKELGELRTKTRAVDLASLFKSAGTRAGAEALYPSDAEVSEEAVKAWVEKNAAFVRDEASSSDDKQTLVSDQTRVNAARLAALADSGSQTLTDTGSTQQQLAGTKTREELDAIYAQIGFQKT